jgi:hypothetical protein
MTSTQVLTRSRLVAAQERIANKLAVIEARAQKYDSLARVSKSEPRRKSLRNRASSYHSQVATLKAQLELVRSKA